MKIKNKNITVTIVSLAVILVLIALINSTYALFSYDAYGSNLNSYSTGMLSIEVSSKSENISLTNVLPMSDEEGLQTTPYIFSIKNIGNLDYQFDVKLLSTGNSSNTFSSQYIKLQIDDGEVTTLSTLTGSVIKDNVILLAGESVDVSIRIWLSSETPNSELGKGFNSKIVADGQAVYTSSNNEYKGNSGAQFIKSLYIKADKTVVSNNNIQYNYATSVNLMNDRLGGTSPTLDTGNIRYYGSSPNNYVYFNCDDYGKQSADTCERWRIIGVFDGKIKIIRADAIGSMAWDTNNTNDWANSSLNSYLNNDYEFSDASVDLISTSTWYIGGYENTSIYSDEMYRYERTNLITGNSSVEWQGNVGLMNASDYGYATDFSLCEMNLYNYSDSNCYGNDWLNLNSYNWILSPTYYAGGGQGGSPVYYVSAVWHIFSGSVNSYGPSTSITSSNSVNPVLFLKENVSFSDEGDGTYDKPYRISLDGDS